jgi:hypothetical protein
MCRAGSSSSRTTATSGMLAAIRPVSNGESSANTKLSMPRLSRAAMSRRFASLGFQFALTRTKSVSRSTMSGCVLSTSITGS